MIDISNQVGDLKKYKRRAHLLFWDGNSYTLTCPTKPWRRSMGTNTTNCFAYDAEGRVIATWGATYPVAYEYDPSGRMIAMRTYRGTTEITSAADLFTLPTDRTTWSYDQPTGLLTNKFYADGRDPPTPTRPTAVSRPAPGRGASPPPTPTTPPARSPTSSTATPPPTSPSPTTASGGRRWRTDIPACASLRLRRSRPRLRDHRRPADRRLQRPHPLHRRPWPPGGHRPVVFPL